MEYISFKHHIIHFLCTSDCWSTRRQTAHAFHFKLFIWTCFSAMKKRTGGPMHNRRCFVGTSWAHTGGYPLLTLFIDILHGHTIMGVQKSPWPAWFGPWRSMDEVDENPWMSMFDPWRSMEEVHGCPCMSMFDRRVFKEVHGDPWRSMEISVNCMQTPVILHTCTYSVSA